MKVSQLMVFCEVLELGDPAPILREVMSRLDTIVHERNKIAHGAVTPGDIGRNYSIGDIDSIVDNWEIRWNDFINWTEKTVSSKGFFRVKK